VLYYKQETNLEEKMKRLVVLLFAILGVNQLFARGTLDLEPKL